MSPTPSRLLPWILAVAIAAVVVALWAWTPLGHLNLAELQHHRVAWTDWTHAHPWPAGLAFVLAYAALTGASLPGATLLTLAAGAVFGLAEGVVLSSFGSSIGATLAFLASRHLFRGRLLARYGDGLQRFDEGLRREGAYYLFALRLVPLVPFFVVNVIAGWTALRVRTFYWVSQLGMLPATVVYVYAGTQLATLDSPAAILSPRLLAAFAAVGVLPLALRALLRWRAARRVYRPFRRPRRFDYDLVVIGAGSAGLVSAYIGAAVRAKVALVEKHRMGGDCLNTGCVPSKALIRAARAVAQAREAGRLGVDVAAVHVDFERVMAHVRSAVREVAPHDSVERYAQLGVDVVLGAARIVSPWEVEVAGRRLSARSLILATGARPLVPPIPGLDTVAYRTSDTVWDLRVRPARLVVLGGGPIGCELAQCFARFGSHVTVVEMAVHLLPREDADVAGQVARRFVDEGIRVATVHKALRVDRGDGAPSLVCAGPEGEVAFGFDELLVALGRKPHVSGFGLEELGIAIADNGTVAADPLLRTNVPNVYVCGDAAGPYQLTHAAAHQAWHAAVNALLAPFWSFRVDYRVLPWVTFTDPEVARVGLSEDEARQRGIAFELTRYPLGDLDRAIADAAPQGFVKVLTTPGKDRILGAAIVGEHAGELIAGFALAMRHRIGLNGLLGTIHAYPTWAEANKQAAGAWKRAHAPQRLLRLAERFFRWRRGAGVTGHDPSHTHIT